MKKVLVLHYSQSGQLNRVVESFTTPLVEDTNTDVTFECLKPKQAFPFPWPIMTFFSIFPETVHMEPPEMEPVSDVAVQNDYDLIILSYQVWFLSPSLPITGFLKSQSAKHILDNKPVITLIGCRNMWLMAQEKMKKELSKLNARLIDNVVLTDKCSTATSFLSTPLWMFTGKKQFVSWIPEAGISDENINNSKRFGYRIVKAFHNDDVLNGPLLKGLGAVKVEDKYIASEKIGNRSFHVWGKLLKALGPQHSIRRKFGLCVYIVFLIIMILTVVPINAILKKLLKPFFKKRMKKQVEYYSMPSGE